MEKPVWMVWPNGRRVYYDGGLHEVEWHTPDGRLRLAPLDGGPLVIVDPTEVTRAHPGDEAVLAHDWPLAMQVLWRGKRRTVVGHKPGRVGGLVLRDADGDVLAAPSEAVPARSPDGVNLLAPPAWMTRRG